MRILAVTNMYPTPEDPAYGAFVATQVRSLARAGVDVQVEFVNGRRGALSYFDVPRRIGRQVKRGGFDLVHAHYGLTGFVAAFQKLPLVVTFYGDDLLGTPDRGGRLTLKSRLIRRFGYAAARRAQGVICMSEEMRQALPRAEDRARAHVIPNGVDTDRFCPGDRAAARARLGLDGAERLVLFPNTPGEARKRLDLAEAGIAAIAAGGPGARLWVVTRVPHDQMPDHYRAADCLLLTSDWEGSPNVVKEALCCDTPVVSVDVGDVKGWLDLTPGCRLVDRTPLAIAAGLHEVLGGPGRVDGSVVRNEISADRIALRVLDVYSDVSAPGQS